MTDEVTTQDQVTPTAIPWYQSKIMRGIVIGFALQIINKVQTKFQVDVSAFGFSANELAQYVLDLFTAAAVAYTAKARIKQEAAPQVVLTKNKADVINAQAPPPTTDGQQPS
jgi:hypothetical protein